MNKLGDGLFEAEAGSATPLNTSQFKLRQGTLEESNVEVIEEMVSLIQSAREFETNEKAINMQDESLDRAVNEVGRVQ